MAPTTISVPDYAGGTIVNLVAELEARLGGTPPSPRLHPRLAAHLPETRGYVVVLFDGLGAAQLDHPAAADLRTSLAATLEAPFPTTTTVSLASLATGLPPSRHALLGYQLWLPDVGQVANTIHWTTLWGSPLEVDTDGFLPSPNLWERLSAVGIEPVTVQPGRFEGSKLTRALYRGCRFEPAFSVDELIAAAAQLAAPGRLLLTYLPHVDFAAHVYGLDTVPYHTAVSTVTTAWSRLQATIPSGIALVGTADHGHIDFPQDRQVKLEKADHRDRIFYGDGRAMFVKGDGASLAPELPARWIERAEMEAWWGPGPRHESFDARAPDGVLLADDEHLLLHRFSDDRMIGNHGALTAAERVVPLLVSVR